MLGSEERSAKSSVKSYLVSGVRKIAAIVLVKYAIVFSLLLSLPVFLGFFDFKYQSGFYISIQVYSFLIGIIHLWQVGKRFEWRNHETFFRRLALTLNIMIVAMILQGFFTWLCTPIKEFWMIFPTSLLPFLIPALFISTFDFAIIIPKPVYKKWRYPSNTILPDPDSIDFTNSHIVTFELRKNVKDGSNTFMKFKAPLDRLTFGDLFYFYMSEYNDRNRESPIQYLDDNNQTYDWQFYVKPHSWWQSNEYIDPSLTVRENKIKENFIIVSERV